MIRNVIHQNTYYYFVLFFFNLIDVYKNYSGGVKSKVSQKQAKTNLVVCLYLQESLVIKAEEKIGNNTANPASCVRESEASDIGSDGIFGGSDGSDGISDGIFDGIFGSLPDWVLIIAVGGVIAVLIILACVLFKLILKKKKPSSKKKKMPIPTIQMSLIAQCDNDFETVVTAATENAYYGSANNMYEGVSVGGSAISAPGIVAMQAQGRI
jgi:hypothetical protein